jgi:D-tyrosyl-tRNA(Tyr) deacylase
MRGVIQRVTEASVEVDKKTVAAIDRGLLVLVGFHGEDSAQDLPWFVDKILNLRIFEHEGRFDRSLMDIQGELLLVPQFTLYADCSRGRRPSFAEAMEPVRAKMLFEELVESSRKKIQRVECGVFQASMKVALVNEGPVTIVLDSRKSR